MDHADLERAVLTHVRCPEYRAVKPAAMAKALGLRPKEIYSLKDAVKQLVKQGKLVYGKNRVVSLPGTSASGRLEGTFRRMSAGHGFVRPTGSQDAGGKSQDIYIAEKHTADASNGDLVRLCLRKRQPRSKHSSLEGEIEKILKRKTYRFVGTYFEKGGQGFVNVDGKVFSSPIILGDTKAKRVIHNDKVVVEIVQFPSHVYEGEGVLAEVLGQRGDPGVDILSIICEYDLPREFGEDVSQDAREATKRFHETPDLDRTDLSEETIITIDPKDAQDFDDAISLTKTKHRHWQLGVHIADVSHFVLPNSPLDREAKNRATSVYLLDHVIPMLPEIISNNLASLQPNRTRYCLTAMLEFTIDGTHVGTELMKTSIKSKRRFTYEEVDAYLEHPTSCRQEMLPEVHELLGRMHQLAMILRKRRLKRGALELSMPEVKVNLDQHGRVTGAHVVQHTESHQMIEEFMLAANEAVATTLQQGDRLFLRRLHGSPNSKKLQELTEFVRGLGLKTESLGSRFAIQSLLDKVLSSPQEHAVHYAVLRSMQKAVYGPETEGHYALASDCYCHFTSPIRRYPDLTVHRLITANLLGKPPVANERDLLALGDHCSDREQRAEKAERDLTKIKLIDYLSSRIGEEMEAVITGVEEYGLFAQGIKLPADGFVHVSGLANDYYRLERSRHSLVGHRTGNEYRLGDVVRVAVAHVDIDRRQLDFRLLKKQSHVQHKAVKDPR